MKKFKVQDRQIRERQKEMWGNDDFMVILLIFIAIYLFVGQIMLNFIITPVKVIGPSMEPTLQNDDRVILYKQDNYNYGEIVVVYAPNVENRLERKMGEDIIKRIMGLPGDTVWFEQHSDGYYYFHRQRTEHGMTVDTALYGEYYISGAMDSNISQNALDKLTLGEDEYYVLGDNRDESLDSRSEKIGAVKLSQIKGKALFIIRNGNIILFEKVKY